MRLNEGFIFSFPPTRAEIYYQTMNVVTIQQDPKYTVGLQKLLQLNFFSFQPQSLFGALGGGLSLYLGCAVVMIFEVIELLVDLVLAFVCGKVLEKLRKPISK